MTDEPVDLPLFRAAEARERRAGMEPVQMPPLQKAPDRPKRTRRPSVAEPSTATVRPFPITRRREFIRRHAARMAELTPRGAENHLATQLEIQAKTMRRRGVEPERIESELQAMETAIRLAFVQLTGFEGGAA